jgi:hypothetical protein
VLGVAAPRLGPVDRNGLQGLAHQLVVVAAHPLYHGTWRDAASVGQHRALDPALAAICWTGSGFSPPPSGALPWPLVACEPTPVGAGAWPAVAAAAPSQPRAHPAGASRHPECAASLSEQISSSSTRIWEALNPKPHGISSQRLVRAGTPGLGRLRTR